MRGKAQDHLYSRNKLRITPAYAGKSRFNVAVQYGIEDHPRLCGEK